MKRDFGFAFKAEVDAVSAKADLLNNGFEVTDADIYLEHDEFGDEWILSPVYSPHEPYSEEDRKLTDIADMIASANGGEVTGTGVEFV